MVVRYEDLRRDSEQVLGQLLEFLGVTPDVRVIRKAIENNSLNRMRAKEDRGAGSLEKHSSLLASHKSAGKGRFVRKGSVGGWRSKLTDAQVRLIESMRAMCSRLLDTSRDSEKRAQSQSTVSAISILALATASEAVISMKMPDDSDQFERQP